jgi:hypothetical protein
MILELFVLSKWLLGAAAVAAVVSVFWDDIRETIAGWLRDNGFQESWVMDAVITFDRVVGQARGAVGRFLATIWVEGADDQMHEVKEWEVAADEIDDEKVKGLLLETRKKRETVSVMEYVT